MDKANIIFNKSIVEKSTGEVISSTAWKGKSRFDADRGYMFRTGQGGLLILPGADLLSVLTEAEAGKLLRLAAALMPDTNCICYRSGNTTKPMQVEQLAKLLHLSERSCRRFISKLLEYRVLGKVYVKVMTAEPDMQFRECRYYINPCYIFCGNWIGRDLYFMFKQDLDKMLPSWVVRKFNS